jgi:Flp pilus assembly pilin Flp
MFNQLKHFATSLMARLAVAREEGQTLVEYSLILALVSVAVIGALALIAGGIEGVFAEVVGALEGA